MQQLSKRLYWLCILSCSFTLSFAQETLFTVDGKPISVDEFTYIYEKTNRNAEDMYSRASLEEYLELYKNFKLKVAKAHDMRLDTIKTLITELQGYRSQLASSYLIDKKVSERLSKELFDRKQKDVSANQILVRIKGTGIAADTLKAYKKIALAYEQLEAGTDFAQVVKKYSEDTKSIKSGGDIGFITAKLPNGYYAVETALYTLPKGAYSKPIRSPQGYHIFLKKDERPTMGEFEVAHLLIRTDKHPRDARQIADSIYQEIESGKITFEKATKRSSEDSKTSRKEGYLGFFKINTYDPAFEKAAFALENDGDISKPVFTRFGFHIIKRISARKNESYDVLKRALLTEIKKDSRYEAAEEALIYELRDKYKLKMASIDTTALLEKLGKDVGSFQWTKPSSIGQDQLFTIGNKSYVESNFLRYLIEEPTTRLKLGKSYKDQALLGALLNSFINKSVYSYAESQLDREYPEFEALMREYAEGILLFEATKMEVWDKAGADSVGLMKFYEVNKNNYKWPPKGELQTLILHSANPKLIKKFNKLAKKPVAKLEKSFAKVDSLFEYKSEWIEEEDVPTGLSWTAPSAGSSITEGLQTTIQRIWKIEPPQVKKLDEARGYIIADYQDQLEKAWIEELKKSYPIEVNQDVFEKLVRK